MQGRFDDFNVKVAASFRSQGA